MEKTKCRLCDLEQKTKWFYEDELFIICNCMTCQCKMIVLKRHDTKLTLEESNRLLKLLIKFAENRRVSFVRRTIPNHWHMHIKNGR